MANPFEPGHISHRKAIHDHYGGQRQGGISTPSSHPLVFLFTGDTGTTYGYRDEFRPDGTFWYRRWPLREVLDGFLVCC